MKGVFVTGISTEVGKTVVSAALCEAFSTDYWKPVQAGDLQFSDSHKVASWATSAKTIHPERYALKTAMSPHGAAAIEDVKIQVSDFQLPKTENNLVVEGAGGLMVPLNDDGLLYPEVMKHLGLPVILVSSFYLGSINHTLLSAALLKEKGIDCLGILYNGTEVKTTRQAINANSGLPDLGCLPQLDGITPDGVATLAAVLREGPLSAYFNV